MRSQTSMTRLMSCSMSSTVSPRRGSGGSGPSARCFSAGLKPAAGSSSSSSFGWWPAPGRSRAGAGRRRAGCGRRRSARSGDADELEQLHAPRSCRRRSSRRYFGVTRTTAPGTLVVWWASAPTITFSSAVMFGNSRMFWNVRAMPRCGDLGAACGPASDCPSKRTSPSVGWNTPVTHVEHASSCRRRSGR